MKKAIAVVLLILVGAQIAFAGPILKAGILKAGVQTAADAAASALKPAAASAGGAVYGLSTNLLRNKMEVPPDFRVGVCTGNGFCYPKYVAATLQDPMYACEQGFTFNVTSLGQAVCLKSAYRPVQTCFKTIYCPADYKIDHSERICMSPDVRGALVGMLTVFKVHATLPFKILPALKTAVTKAVVLPASLVNSLSIQVPDLAALKDGDEKLSLDQMLGAFPKVTLNLTKPDWDLPAIRMGHLLKQSAMLASAGPEVAEALSKGQDPMGIVINSLANINMTELLDVMPQIDAWVSEKLQGLTNINNITAEISRKFPDCLYRCCKDDVVLDTIVDLATKVCSSGLELNSFLDRCLSRSGYTVCPPGMTRCDLPMGQPICMADNNIFGLETCRLAALLSPSLPKQQCPL